MGASGSVLAASAEMKPEDAEDIKNLADAKAEISRLRLVQRVMTNKLISASGQKFARSLVDAIVSAWQEKDDDEDTNELGEVTEDQLSTATSIVLEQFVAWGAYHAHDLQGNVGSLNEYDDETLTTLTAASIDPALLNGNSRAWWGPADDPPAIKIPRNAIVQGCEKAFGYNAHRGQESRGKYLALGFLVRLLYEFRRTCNLGAIQLKGLDPPRLLFRCQTMVGSDKENSCFRSLIKHGGVKHVFNIYAGHFPLHDLIRKEGEMCAEAGVTFDNEKERKTQRKWRKLIHEEEHYEENKAKAMALCAKQIKSILNPNGQAPTGNLLVHCGGGMHRTGMIVGIIRRFLNKDDTIEEIIADYRRHVDYRNEANPGGAEKLNERFIAEFDLSLLEREGLDGLVDPADEKELGEAERDEWGFRYSGTSNSDICVSYV